MGPRTLIVTSRLLGLLDGAGCEAVVNEVKRFELFADGGVATVALRRPDLVIERSVLVRSLADAARVAGAQIVPGRRFLGMRPSQGALTLMLERVADGTVEEFSASTLIGADGAFSPVARAAGWPRQATAPLIQAVVRLPESMPCDTARVWFVPEDTPYFYWMIPESRDRGVVGLIGEEGGETRRCLERFLERRGLTASSFQGARIPVYRQWWLRFAAWRAGVYAWSAMRPDTSRCPRWAGS